MIRNYKSFVYNICLEIFHFDDQSREPKRERIARANANKSYTNISPFSSRFKFMAEWFLYQLFITKLRDFSAFEPHRRNENYSNCHFSCCLLLFFPRRQNCICQQSPTFPTSSHSPNLNKQFYLLFDSSRSMFNLKLLNEARE